LQLIFTFAGSFNFAVKSINMRLTSIVLLALFSGFIFAQNQSKPKLIVGVVVDQMRFDYLTKFDSHYSEDGFKRLKREGFEAKNLHFNYVPTYTGPGHASIFTGTSPMNHGIISNTWYDKFQDDFVYCAGDVNVKPLGTDARDGQMSPHRMLTTTFADQNRLHTQFRGKTIGISIKDRGAILPAGHTANAAYWFYGKDKGHFISSTFYQDELPKWVKKFNKSKVVENYLKKDWNTFKNIESYTESGSDLNNYEHGFEGKDEATFPYNLKALNKQNGQFDILKATAFGNSIIVDFAKEAIKAEDLGQDEHTDVLTLSFSSTDYVGHNFGVNSKEIQDTYIRLDQDIAALLTYLDIEVGEDNYTLFLTADHGAVHVPQFLKDRNIPAGYFDTKQLEADLNTHLNKIGFENVIKNVSNQQIFLNYDLLETQANSVQVQREIKHFLLQYPRIDRVFTRENLDQNAATTRAEALIKNGFHPKRSGDIIFAFEPSYISYPKKGSTHGSGLNYDTQAPFLFFGKGVKPGYTYKKLFITDIAPTISALLGIEMPNGATGSVIEEALD